jgi:Protein of unknown function (DUF2490)
MKRWIQSDDGRKSVQSRPFTLGPLLFLAVAIVSLPIRVGAQTDQLLPEVDVYYKLNSNMRVYFQAKQTREGGLPVTAELGPSVDLYLRQLSRLIDTMAFDKDDSKAQLIVASVGYRYLPYPDAPTAHRLEPYVTINVGAAGRLLLSDKNRADLDWQSGKFTWRYRNRPTLERPFKVRSYHLSPYVSAEFWYTSQYTKWSDTSIFAGCLFPLGKHFDFNPYYEHQNSTGKKPNQQLDQAGLLFKIWL